MYSEAGGNGCRAAPAPLIIPYNIFDGSFCFSDSHKSNSRYNPDPGTPVFCACGFSHKSAAAPIWLQKQNPVILLLALFREHNPLCTINRYDVLSFCIFHSRIHNRFYALPHFRIDLRPNYTVFGYIPDLM